MTASRFLQVFLACFIITAVFSQQPIVSVYEIEDGGTFSVTCDASRMTTIPSNVTDITYLEMSRQTSQDTEGVTLAAYEDNGQNYSYKYIPPGREWTVDFIGANNGTNNRNTMKIVIQVSDAVCQDAGVYECDLFYVNGTGDVSIVSRPECVNSKSCELLQTNQEGVPVVSQQPIVSVDEIEDGGTFSVTCDVSRMLHIPSYVTNIIGLGILRHTSQGTDWVSLAKYQYQGNSYDPEDKYIDLPPGREWTVEFTGVNNVTNNRDTMKIVIQVSDAVCQDAGVYLCTVEYRDSIGNFSYETRSQCVTYKSAVEDIILVADKNLEVPGRPNYSEYEEGDNINLTCRINGPQKLEMKWKTGTYDTVSGFITSDYPYDNDITTFYPTLITSGPCSQYEHMSVLNLRSLSQDVNDQVMYLCVVMENDKPNATEVASTNLTIGVTSKLDLCPEEFCKNGGACKGLYTCDCSSTDFFGPTCQDTREKISVNIYVFASIDPDNNIVVTSSGNLTFHGSVTLRRQDNKVSLVIPAGSYVTLNGPVKTSCLGDIDTCTSGFTITTTHSFSSVSSTETLVALTTGAHLEAGVKGVSLYYESGNVNCHVVTSTQEWSIVQKFKLAENEWYNMTVSWQIGQGLYLLLGNDVIGSDATSDKLPEKATDEKPILIGSEKKTTSNSEMNVNSIITSPIFWREIQRAGIYFIKEPSSESSPLEIAQIVGIAVGCFAALVFSTVAVVGLVYFIRRDSRGTPQTPGVKPDGYVTPTDAAYNMSTSNPYVDYNNSNSQDYISPSPDYDYITDDYLTLEPETTFSNQAPVLPNPRGSIDNPYDRRVVY